MSLARLSTPWTARAAKGARRRGGARGTAVAMGRGVRIDRWTHIARLAVCLLALTLAPRALGLPGALVAAMALWLAGFAAAHDLIHGALGVGRAAGDAALTLVGALLLTSGHAMRVSHLLHHKRPLADGDYEGAAAHGGLVRACALSPWWSFATRLRAYAVAGERLRRRQLVEHALALALVAALWASCVPSLRVYVLTALVAQATAPVWAGRVPHRAPAWLLTVASAVGRLGSPTALALAYHEAHHAAPRTPCARLGA
jgi:fatty acid desaturase